MVLCGGGGKPEVAGLWIDYVLLPERLEEHLEGLKNGSLSSPSHAELVNMFLDQAVSSYRLSRKEPDAQTPSSANRGSKTVAVLCERAARVAIAGEFVLGDIESLIPRHQSLLLKALIKHDKPRSLLHECNFHRWVIRKTLGPEALGPFATNAFLRAGSHGATSDSAAEFYQDTLLVDGSHIEAGPSVTYLENVLEREKVLEENHEVKKKLLSVSSEENHDKVMEENHEEKMKKKQLQNGLIKEGVLKEDYICQILFDVAEAHFMRGRSKRAHELFSKCGHLASKLTACPVPQERLNGFIVACRAITNSAATDCQNELKAPIPANQEAVFACEKSRSSIKRKSQAVSLDYCNGVHEIADGNRSKKIAVIKSNGVAEEHLKQVPSANGSCELKPNSETLTSAEEGGKDLVDVVADDVSARNLSWGYCLSLETDGSLPALIRVKVAICNVLRSVLEGGSFDSFLRISGQIDDNREAVVFLLQLMAKTIDGREGKGTDDSDLVSRVRQFCNYVCCTVEQSWCWKLASKHGLISAEITSKLGGGIDQPFPQGVTRWGGSSGMITLDILQADSVAAVEQAATSACGHAPESIAKLVQQRAFAALEKEKDPKFARQLYTLAKRICSESIDNELFLWFLDRKSGALPEKVEGYDCPSYGAAEYVFVKLMEAEQWSSVQELCSWAQQRHFMEDKAVAFIFKEADVLGALIPMCSGEIGSSAKDDEIIRKLEDLMTLLHGEKDEEASRSSSDSLLPGPKAFPIISKLSRVESLQALETLLAGWINGLQAAAPLVELARYGALAQVTANIRPRALKASADCGKKLFTALLQRLLKLPRAAEKDSSKGSSRCLLGLADLAFVDQAYLEALQLYLQAGAVRSSFYCDRVTSMARELFTPWVITRMIAACKEIGAQLQAAILCQCLPDPDYESAFQILQANPLIVDQDAALYFECVWEMPLLELLVHLHAKAGDRGRVNMLISLLQQPALNVHNPASIRKAHIAAMEQRFLQRFYAELM